MMQELIEMWENVLSTAKLLSEGTDLISNMIKLLKRSTLLKNAQR